jgi:hypothetical protein
VTKPLIDHLIDEFVEANPESAVIPQAADDFRRFVREFFEKVPIAGISANGQVILSDGRQFDVYVAPGVFAEEPALPLYGAAGRDGRTVPTETVRVY